MSALTAEVRPLRPTLMTIPTQPSPAEQEIAIPYWPKLAKAIGRDEQLFLAQLDYWISKSSNERDGRRWVYNTVDAWAEQFCDMSRSAIGRTIKSLKEQGLIESTSSYNTRYGDRTQWYAINYDHPELAPFLHLLKSKTSATMPYPKNGISDIPETGHTYPANGISDIPQMGFVKGTGDYVQEITQETTPPYPPRRKSETEQRDHDVVTWWCKVSGARQPADKGAALNAAHALLAAGFTLDTLPGLYEHVKAKATVGATLPMLVKWADGYQAKQTPAKPVDDERPELKAGPGRMLCVERKDVVIRRKTTLLPEMQAKYDERIAEIDAKLGRLGVTVQEAEAWALRH